MSEEKRFNWKEFAIDKISDLAILIVGLEIYSHREKIGKIFDKMKSAGEKYDLPIDEIVDRVYSKLWEKVDAVLPEKVDEIMKKYNSAK